MKFPYHLFDPEKTRKLPRPLSDVLWSLPIKIGEKAARSRYKTVKDLIDTSDLVHYRQDRGEELEETAVTEGQVEILILGLESVANLPGEVAEIGSWRGVTTLALAKKTSKIVFAIDPHPFDAFPGVKEAYEAFQQRTSAIVNIRYVRACSGDGASKCSNTSFSFIFIDAMHDFVSVNYDLNIWAKLLNKGGLLALHDVDDHPGVNLALQHALNRKDFRPWGYCPNLMVLKKI